MNEALRETGSKLLAEQVSIEDSLNTYEISDPQGKLLTTVQGNDPRTVLGVMMLVWGEGIKVKQVEKAR